MSKIRWDVDPSPPPPEPTPPPGGWMPITCSFESHRWELDVEEGRASVRCADPCDPDLFEPGGRTPACLCDWLAEDFFTPEPIPVHVKYVDDSSPSTPNGPAEWGYYLVVSAAALPSDRPQP